MGVGRGTAGLAAGKLLVTTTFTGVGVGSTLLVCPITGAAANSEIVQNTTLFIIKVVNFLGPVGITGCERPA